MAILKKVFNVDRNFYLHEMELCDTRDYLNLAALSGDVSKEAIEWLYETEDRKRPSIIIKTGMKA